MGDSDFDFDDESYDVSEDFTSASMHVHRIHGSLEPEALLILYGLYKQATIGPCNIAKPSIFQMQARTKWSAWHELGNLSCSEAQNRYVKKVQELDPTWQTHGSSAMLKTPFGWVVHSIQQQPHDPEDCKPEHEKTSLDYVKELNLNRLREILKPENLSEIDTHGMALIHWATDRNAPDILEHLITNGADINHRDMDLQTPLHYAASCGHVDVMRILIKYNADRSLCDNEGRTCLDVAETEEVRALLLLESCSSSGSISSD